AHRELGLTEPTRLQVEPGRPSFSRVAGPSSKVAATANSTTTAASNQANVALLCITSSVAPVSCAHLCQRWQELCQERSSEEGTRASARKARFEKGRSPAIEPPGQLVSTTAALTAV